MKDETIEKIALTHGEEEVMQSLWELGEGYIGDIIARMPEPQPKYTTVATFLKILETKGAVEREAVGKRFLYRPLLPRERYARSVMGSMIRNYFGGSLARMVTFFSQHEDISSAEMDEILEAMKRISKERTE